MKRALLTFFLGLCLLSAGCGAKKQEPAVENKPGQETSRETKTLAPGEGSRGARVEFVTRRHSMERITFSGGYLRKLPEEKPESIFRPAPAGAQGMIFGKREIGGLEWAKVATRDGVTAWYAVPARAGAAKNEKRAPLQISSREWISVFPQITEGVTPQVQDRINQELGNYFSVFRHVTGPVGGEMTCEVTYNRRGILSLRFQARPVLFRSYPVSEVNNLAFWAQLKKYASVSPLAGGADPGLLLAAKTDLQYAMTFDLATGQRLPYTYFTGSDARSEVARRIRELGADARGQENDFYVNDKGQLMLLLAVNQPEPGRTGLDLSDLVIRDY